MKRHADGQERNLPPESSLAMYPECTPMGPRPMNPEWVLSSKEAQKLEMNMYPQGKVISIFQKKKKNVEFQVVTVLNYILHRLKKKKNEAN